MNVVEKDGAITFAVRVVPRASRSQIAGEYDGALKIHLTSPPVDGAANAELTKLLAKTFGVSKSDIESRKLRAMKFGVVRDVKRRLL